MMKIVAAIFCILAALGFGEHFACAFSSDSSAVQPENSFNEVDLELNDAEKGNLKVSDEFRSERKSFQFQSLSEDLQWKSWNLMREKMCRLSAGEISISFMKLSRILSCGL
jgi:hypothetical protein